MRKGVLVTFLTLLLTIIFTGAAYAYYLYDVTSDSVSEMNDNYYQESVTSPSSPSTLRGPLLFLIIGTADRPGDPALADVIMGVSVNPDDKSTLLFNIPRDTRVDIPGRPHPEKINHAYSYGGTELVEQVAEQKLGYTFDFTLEMNMDGFKELVDAVGGVSVENDFAFSQDDIHHHETYRYDEGVIDLDGDRALQYVRMRKQDPRGDLGRNERQRKVLTALLEKARSIDGILQSKDIITTLGNNVRTNLTMSDLQALLTHYRDVLQYTRTFELHGQNEMHQGISYYMVSQKEWEKAQLRIENHQNR